MRPSTVLLPVLLAAVFLPPSTTLAAPPRGAPSASGSKGAPSQPAKPVAPTPDVLLTQAPFQATPAELLARRAPKAPPGGDVEVLLDDTSYRFDAQGKRVSEYRMVYRVLSEAAVENWATLSSYYQPWYQQKPTFRARVITPDGKAHALDEKTLTDQLANSDDPNMYSDRHELSAPLPAVRVGSVVETQIVIPEHKVFFASGALERHVVYTNVYAALTRVTVSAPESLKLSHAVSGTSTKATVKREHGTQTITLLERDQLPLRKWPDLPDPDRAYLPTLDFSTAKSWTDVATAYAQAVDAQLAGFDAKGLAKDILAGETDRTKKLEKLLAYLHREVRYTGLELGDRSILPAAPGDVLTHHYGDCKDKATLLVGLLRAAGFDAHVALLRTGPRHDVAQNLPGMGMFDHAIVHVGGKDSLWIDATAEHSGPFELPYMYQDRLALVAKPGTRGLERTPRTRAADSVLSEDVYINFSELGKASLREVTTGHGALEAELRQTFDRSDDQLLEHFKAYVKERYGAQVTASHAEAARDPSSDFKLEIVGEKADNFETFDDGGFAQVIGNSLFAHVPDTLTDTPKDKRSKEEEDADVPDARHREAPALPVYMPRAHTNRVAYHLSVADGFRWHTLPDPLVFDVEGIHLARTTERTDDRNIQVTFELRTDARSIPAAALEKVRTAFHEFSEQAPASIRFVHAARDALDQGELEDALKIHRGLVAKYPKSVPVQSRYAQDLLRAGLGLAARKAAEQLVKQSPDSARAQWTLGYVYLFDEAGRDSYPGADFARAEKALRVALARDPDEDGYYTGLATVLTHLALEKRPVDIKRLEEAAGLYEKLRTRFKKHDSDEELLRNYVWREKHREAQRLAEEMGASDDRNGLWVASVASSDGATSAQRKAEQLAGGNARNLLLQSSSVLALMGRYSVARAITDLPSVRPHASTYARTFEYAAKHAECEAKLKPAAKVVVDWMRGYLLAPERLEHIERDLDKLPEHTLDAQSLASNLRAIERSAAAKGRGLQGLMLPFIGDALPCASRWEVEENQGAVRVKVYQVGAPGGTEPSMYLLRPAKQGHALIAAHEKGRTVGFSRAMLLALGEKKLDEARAWAEWAYKEVETYGGHRERYSFSDGAKALWPKDLKSATAEDLTLLAAYLAGGTGDDGRELKVLEAAAKRPGLATDKLRAINFARAWDYWKPELADKQSQLLAEFHREFPEDKDLWERFIGSLYRSKKNDDLARELDAYDAKHKDNTFTSGLRNSMDRRAGRYAKVVERTQSRLEAHQASAGELNNVAWDALFAGGDLNRAVALAEAACEPESDASANALHTLATLYAETGSLSKAQVKLMAAMNKRGGDEISKHEWYTWGRIAERAGLLDVARESYAHVEKPEIPGETDTYELAQKRLKQLGR